MKKFLFVLAVALQTVVVSAQNHKNFDRGKMSDAIAAKMAENLLLDEKTSKEFIPVYKEYSERFWQINAKYRHPGHSKDAVVSDAGIEERIKAGFKKSQEILDLRIEYYDKFRKVLSPRQIEGMYRAERNIGEKARKGNGPHRGSR